MISLLFSASALQVDSQGKQADQQWPMREGGCAAPSDAQPAELLLLPAKAAGHALPAMPHAYNVIAPPAPQISYLTYAYAAGERILQTARLCRQLLEFPG